MCRVFIKGIAPEARARWQWVNPATVVIVNRGGVAGKQSLVSVATGDVKAGLYPAEGIDLSEFENQYVGTLSVIADTLEALVKKGFGARPVSLHVRNAVYNAFGRLQRLTRENPGSKPKELLEVYLGEKSSPTSKQEEDAWKRIIASMAKLSNLQVHQVISQENADKMRQRIARAEEQGKMDARLKQNRVVLQMVDNAWSETPEGATETVDFDQVELLEEAF